MYRVEDGPTGFVISSRYAVKQAEPDSRQAQADCTKQLLSTAQDLADSLQRKIQPIREDRVKVRMGRNAAGLTTCDASVPVTWAR